MHGPGVKKTLFQKTHYFLEIRFSFLSELSDIIRNDLKDCFTLQNPYLEKEL